MGELRSYRDLDAWRTAMELSENIYKLTAVLPDTERYGLISQLRRSSVSVPSNIAEGQARFSANEFHYFLGRARGSLVEVETQLMIAQNLAYFSQEQGKQLFDKANELGKILNGLGGAVKQAA